MPLAETKDIVVQELEKEVLIYNLNNYRAVNLNEPVAYIWNLCDGERTVEEIKKAASKKLNAALTDEYVLLCLAELEKHHLLIKNSFSGLSAAANEKGTLSRRDVMRKIALTSAVALPIISAVVVPTAAAAASVRCTNDVPDPVPGRSCPSINCITQCGGYDYEIIIVNRCRKCVCFCP